MPLFRCQIFKRIFGTDREWSNTYTINATDLATAVAAADPIPNREANFHADNIVFTRMRLSDLVPHTDVFTVVPLALLGSAYTVADNDFLPLFNCVRVDISVDGGGRPSRKYYRPPVGEQWQTKTVLDTTVRSLFHDEVVGMIADVISGGAQLVDPDGQAWSTPATFPAVAMHQLHRKRKKKPTTP